MYTGFKGYSSKWSRQQCFGGNNEMKQTINASLVEKQVNPPHAE